MRVGVSRGPRRGAAGAAAAPPPGRRPPAHLAAGQLLALVSQGVAGFHRGHVVHPQHVGRSPHRLDQRLVQPGVPPVGAFLRSDSQPWRSTSSGAWSSRPLRTPGLKSAVEAGALAERSSKNARPRARSRPLCGAGRRRPGRTKRPRRTCRGRGPRRSAAPGWAGPERRSTRPGRAFVGPRRTPSGRGRRGSRAAAAPGRSTRSPRPFQGRTHRAAVGGVARCHHSPCSRNRRASSAWRRGWMFMAVWSVAGNSVRRLLTILPGRGQNGPKVGRYNRCSPHSS